MPENRRYLPEGLCSPVSYTLSELKEALEKRSILCGTALRCDAALNLHIQLGNISAVIPHEEAVAPWMSGAGRDISVLSRVGKVNCFTVSSIAADAKGAPAIVLSRRDAQETAMNDLLERLKPGSVLSGQVTHLDHFGAFVDIGSGIIAMLPIEHISVSRISHPRERLQVGQKILAAVRSIDPGKKRIVLTHKELLGSWMENASCFHVGETVQGIVRSVKEYGTFIELTPNLSGLSDNRESLAPGDAVSVFIKSIRPERMKIKLQVIEKLPPLSAPQPLRYQITDGILEHWRYSPPNYEKEPIETDFTASCP